MFRKLVSNLSFSPALIGQVGFYAHRLKQEEVTRRLTVVFVILAVVVQSLVVFAPPESANASSAQDLIRGGVQNLDDLLVRYDKNTDDIKDIYTTIGVTRSEIAAAKPATVNSKDTLYSVSRISQYSPEAGETSFTYKRSEGGTGIRYISPLSLADTSAAKKQSGTRYEAWVGQSASVGWFAILKTSASMATKGYPVTIAPDSSTATSAVKKTISSLNLAKGTDATTKPAQPLDKISYTITAQNGATKTSTAPLTVNLTDALEYATLIDDGGGTLDPVTHILSWPAIKIPAGASQERTFVLQVVAVIPSTPTGSSNGSSYDCIMSTTFGTNAQINVSCPVAKGVESIIDDLPPAGILTNVIFAMLLLTVVFYFYFRTRQLKKEIRLIRHSFNTGTM